MPDRHGPLKVLYQTQQIPSTNWTDFEDDTPNDVLDRTTRGILRSGPEWLGDVLTPNEVTAVEEAFDVTIEGPGDGGEVTPPADRFGVEQFDAFRVEELEIEPSRQVLFEPQAEVVDADGDDDLTGIRIAAELTEGGEGPSVTEPAEEGGGSAMIQTTDPLVIPLNELPVTATLSASDADSGEEFVDLGTVESPVVPLPLTLPLDQTTKWVQGESVDGGDTFADTWTTEIFDGGGEFTTAESGYPPENPLVPNSAWGTEEGSGKQGLYFAGGPGFRALPPEEYPFDLEEAPPAVSDFYPLREYTVSDIAFIAYNLRKPSGELSGSDIYLSIYTAPEDDGDDTAWYDSRLQALPSEANFGDPTFGPDEFYGFVAGDIGPLGGGDESQVNSLNFYDSGRSDIGPGETEIPKPSPGAQATLADLKSDEPVNWETDGERDYSDETVLGLSLQTGSDASADLTAYFDFVAVALESGELLVLDLGTTEESEAPS